MSEKPKEPPHTPLTTGAFVVGIFIGLLGFCLMTAVLKSFLWELKTHCLYTEGKCRVVSSRIGTAIVSGDTGGAIPALYVTHQVEVDGKVYPPSENTEQFTPEANSVEELAPYQALYADGSVHPCWYDASDPARYSVLIHDGLHPWKKLAYCAIPLPVFGLSFLMMRWAHRSGVRRETKKMTGASEKKSPGKKKA